MEIVEAARRNGIEEILEHSRLGKFGLDVVIGVGEAINAENLPELVGAGGGGAQEKVIRVALPIGGEDAFQAAKHRAVLAAVGIDNGVGVVSLGIAEGAIAVVEKDPAGAIAGSRKSVVEIVGVVGVLSDGIINVGAGEIEPGDDFGILAAQRREVRREIVGVAEIPIGVKNVFLGRIRGRRSLTQLGRDGVEIGSGDDVLSFLLDMPRVEEPESQHDESEEEDNAEEADEDEADFLGGTTRHGRD